MKKYLPIIFLITILFLGLINAIHAQTKDYPTIVEDYPNLPACENNAQCHPGQAEFGFPQFIKYIYLFALGIVGIIGFVAIIMAAFGYVTSAGNPQQASNAKDKIISALLGLLLLLGSVVLLNMINPDFLKLKLEAPAVTVDVPTETPPTTGCRYEKATWKPTTLNAGQSATLTIKKVGCTQAETQNDTVFIDLRQVSPGVSKDLVCDRITNAGKFIGATDTQWVKEYTMDKYCTDIKVPCKNPLYLGPIICNMQKDKAESFYLTGWIERPDQPKQYIPQINITVIDGR